MDSSEMSNLSETDFSNRNSGIKIMNDSDIQEKNRSQECETDFAEMSENIKEKDNNITGQSHDNHQIAISLFNNQDDKIIDIHSTQSKQNQNTAIEGTSTSDTSQYNRNLNKMITILPFSSEQTNILTKENSWYTFADSSNVTDNCSSELRTDAVQCCGINRTSQNLLQQSEEKGLPTHMNTQIITQNTPALFCDEDAPPRSKNDFQPIILDVRGGCCDIETEYANETGSFDCFRTAESTFPTISAVKTIDVNEKIGSSPKSAFQLLQNVISASANCLQPITSFKEKQCGASNANTEEEKSITHPLLPLVDKSNKTKEISNSRQNHKLLLKKLQSDLASKMQSKRYVPQSSLLNIPLHLQTPTNSKVPSSGVLLCPVTTEAQQRGLSQLQSNVIFPINTGTAAYSCVIVQDNTQNKNSNNKVALLIPQSLPIGGVASSAPSVVSQMPVAAASQTNATNIHTSQIHINPLALPAHNNTQIPENISKLVTETMNSFVVQGKDLTGSDLLMIDTTKNKDYPKGMLKCAVCGEGYHHEHSLNFHLKRTSFHLSFHCPYCKKRLSFYNKCSLWMHIKTETDRPMLNLSDILCLKPYELDENNYTDVHTQEITGTVCALDISVAPEPRLDVRRDETLPARTAQVEEVSKALSNDHPTDLVEEFSRREASSVKCPSCLLPIQNFQDHVCPEQLRKLMCSICGMFLPSVYSLDAHIDIHNRVTTKKSCPECRANEFETKNGEDNMKPAFDHFDSCCHFNRVLHITCFCKKEFTQGNTLLKHFASRHISTLFKCHFCVLAFTKHDLLVGHVAKEHKNKYTHIKASVLCLYCQQISNSPVELDEHINKHMKNFKINALFKWKCFVCTKLYADKDALKLHVGSEHLHKVKRCTICYSLFSSRKNLVDHIVQKRCSRFLSKNLNCCVDLLEEHENVAVETENIDLKKLFECSDSSVHEELEQNCNFSQGNKSEELETSPSKSSEQPQERDQTEQQHNGMEKSYPSQKEQQKHPTVSLSSNSSIDKAGTKQCKIIITKNSNLSVSNKSTSVSVTQCNVCKIFIESTQIANHLKIHQSQGVIICFLCQRKDFKTVEDAMEHSAKCGIKSPENTQIRVRFESSKSEKVTTSAKSGGPQDVELLDSQVLSEIASDEIQTLHSVFPCLLCGLAFESLSSREAHVSRSHDGTRIVYHCGLCRKRGKATVFTRRELATRHITKKHRIVNMDTVNRLIRTEEQNVNSGEKLPSSQLKEDRPESEPAPKRLRVAAEGDYLCGKCGFSCSDSEGFSRHITCHNPSKEPQCPECGLCFTVFPALKKHLLAVHKIRAVDDYLKEKNLTEPELDEEDMDSLPEIHPFSKPQSRTIDFNNEKHVSSAHSSSSDPLECKVCYKVFDDEATLKTHMRNHGMAFIRSKRRKL